MAAAGEFSRRYDGTVLPPSHDIVIQHEEYRQYMRDGRKHVTPKPQNTYYHPSLACIRAKHAQFTSDELCFDKVSGKLSSEHVQYLQEHFGITL